ncbi:carbon-nitrogen hydrolase family protein [Nocardioides marmoriginsengisoli]|uniref:Carbon-nitrogen hydrolase family protein n=1 Tax=Nocardioides marmoriginsengisoli TaxID=661483 RepID=A0A3N0CF41_9ACTN|nr:carbon-nitrogen hydrolase family protein [Nocardioides marmoriginsengisoli]RNL62074.1 carbon-nitrogen hydrolase family protein [Nocardioides marmoriginsengisoli]
MGEALTVAVWQHAAALDPAGNRAALETVDPAPGTDLIVLPEAFARDFGEPGSELAPYAEPLDGPFVQALDGVARRTGASVLGGMFEQGDDPARPFNTLVLTDGASRTTYRKIHLYDSFGQRETDLVTPGPTEPVTADLGGLRLGLMTCYDLRFPELARALSARGAEALVLPAAWVAGPGKLDHWLTLLRARAIENVCWVVAAGQPGPRYTGHSVAIAPTGDVVAELDDAAGWFSVDLDPEVVRTARERNPSLSNRRM